MTASRGRPTSAQRRAGDHKQRTTLASAVERGRRMARGERREQILGAATEVFARAGFAATSLDDIAAEAGVSRVILYRHFESKAQLYRAVLDRATARVAAATGAPRFGWGSVDALLEAAAADPAAFRLLFEQAAREPEFRREMDRRRAAMIAVAQRQLGTVISDRAWKKWAARAAPAVTIEAVLAWLDAGQPDPDLAADRVRKAVEGVVRAAAGRSRPGNEG